MMMIATGSGGLAAFLGALFIAGFAGSLTHCAPMCGPFVLAQVSANLERTPASRMSEWTRLKGAALIPYHLGRFTTYCMLGAISAVLVHSLAEIASLRWIVAILLATAAAAFLLQALGRSVRVLPKSVSTSGIGWLSRRIDTLAEPLIVRARNPGARYLLGVVLGFLPCGLLYGALAAAATAGSATAGALAMGVFTLGTVPALFAVGMAGSALMKRNAAAVQGVVTVLMLANAAALSYLAFSAIS